ncbi:hypothetical protein I6N90_18685 [Paenibacillus sp. GSMTC-2017]|uniref:sensor histidine kinase n=1 Tax=Paenibacillus sp. GSMTC-2017 TaxID=2794350 RepID=UPI001A3138F0|nr:ATP-binding protein [Paenibacillus sp. GSMTC-2017]MBH5319830.1 hypothetical protein [Paenibacillus sp. GSMTC-2017]
MDRPITRGMNIEAGDRILSFDDSSNPKLFVLNNEKMITDVKKIKLLDKQGLQRTIVIEPTQSDKFEIGFSFLIEIFLLGVGWYAFRKMPDSRLIHKFFLINMVIAFCIVAMFSEEIHLSYYFLPYCVIWLPYLLLSFYLLFAFRSIHFKFHRLLQFYRLYAIGFSICTTYFFYKQVTYQWVTDVFNIVLILTLMIIGGITAMCWTRLDRIEKRQLFILFIGVLISILPYVLLHAIPDLLWTGFIVSIKYTFIGLVPISGTLTYLLVRRQIIDLKMYVPKIIIHILYYSLALGLILWSSDLGEIGYGILLFIVFGLMTYGYRLLLKRLKRQEDSKEDWLENQKLRLSLQLAEKKYIRDSLKLFSSVLEDKIKLQGSALVYMDDVAEPVAHLSGIYEFSNRNDWSNMDEFDQVLELSLGPKQRKLGYLCLSSKRNGAQFTTMERDEIERFRVQLTEVLSNGKRLFQLQSEYEYNKDQMKRHEHQLHDFRTYSQMLVEAREAEKIRISYFLHDDLLQNLIFLSRDIEELHDTGRYEAERAAAWLKCLYDSQCSIRSLSDHLYPHILDRGDLKEALTWCMRDMNREDMMAVALQYEVPVPEPFPAFIKANMFRAIRELIVNCFKHAEATELNVRVWMLNERIYCSVSDNGKGFSDISLIRHHAGGGKSFGLLSVCDQIEHLGGHVDVNSVLGKGTTVTLNLPLMKKGISYER